MNVVSLNVELDGVKACIVYQFTKFVRCFHQIHQLHMHAGYVHSGKYIVYCMGYAFRRIRFRLHIRSVQSAHSVNGSKAKKIYSFNSERFSKYQKLIDTANLYYIA